ncbi:MAG: hypothetical protein HC819_11090 [Cyclobacteriaceae bacterium]|nr:hypothetical protein [Cyclobacteriaceae bacterium]
MSEEFTRKLVIDGRSKSTLENYFRQMAKLAMHYKAPRLKKPFAKQDVNQIFWKCPVGEVAKLCSIDAVSGMYVPAAMPNSL